VSQEGFQLLVGTACKMKLRPSLPLIASGSVDVLRNSLKSVIAGLKKVGVKVEGFISDNAANLQLTRWGSQVQKLESLVKTESV